MKCTPCDRKIYLWGHMYPRFGTHDLGSLVGVLSVDCQKQQTNCSEVKFSRFCHSEFVYDAGSVYFTCNFTL